MRLVQTESQSPLETLWRQFAQLKHATMVGWQGWASADDKHGHGMVRTFRTLDGKYVRIMSTETGNRIIPIPADEVEVYENVWKQLGSRALSRDCETRSDIVLASSEFFEITEELIGEEWVEDDEGEAGDTEI